MTTLYVIAGENMKYKIYWKRIFALILLSVILTLSIQDFLLILNVPQEQFNNKILLFGQISIAWIIWVLYLVSKIGKVLEIKKGIDK